MDLSAPLHLQALERFLDVNRLLKEVEEAVHDPVPTIKYSWNDDAFDEDEILVDIDHKPEDKYIYDMSELTDDNMWLKDMLLSDSSESSDDEEMTETEMRRILRRYKAMKKVTESIRHQSSQYSGYSTSILASSDVPFHLETPDEEIDLTDVPERRGKRRKVRHREHTPPPQLSIRDMIDALTSSMDKQLPEELVIENGKEDHCEENNHNEEEEEEEEEPKRKEPADIWNSVIEEGYLYYRRRKHKLEIHACKRAKVCAEIQRGLIKLKSIKQDIITIPDDQTTKVCSEEIDLAAMETDDVAELEEDPTEKMLGEAEEGDDAQTDNDVKDDVQLSVEDVKDDVVVAEVVEDDVEAAKEVELMEGLDAEIMELHADTDAEIMELDADTEISEADILDQSEIVNKKREEMLALLKQLEDQMKAVPEVTEVAEAKAKVEIVPVKKGELMQEEMMITEEDMCLITVEDLEKPDEEERREEEEEEDIKEEVEMKVELPFSSKLEEVKWDEKPGTVDTSVPVVQDVVKGESDTENNQNVFTAPLENKEEPAVTVQKEEEKVEEKTEEKTKKEEKIEKEEKEEKEERGAIKEEKEERGAIKEVRAAIKEERAAIKEERAAIKEESTQSEKEVAFDKECAEIAALTEGVTDAEVTAPSSEVTEVVEASKEGGGGKKDDEAQDEGLGTRKCLSNIAN